MPPVPMLKLVVGVPRCTLTRPVWTKKTICILREFFVRFSAPGGRCSMPAPKKGVVMVLANRKEAFFTGRISIPLAA